MEYKGFLSRKFIFVAACQVATIVLTVLGYVDGGQFVTVTLGLAGVYVAGNAASKFVGGAAGTNGD